MNTSSIPVRTKVARKQRRTGTPKTTLVGIEIAVPIVVLALWWILSANSTNVFFPPLQEILLTFWELAQTSSFWVNVGSSVGNLVLSFFLACVLGVVLGTAFGSNKYLSWLFEPTLNFFRAIPPVALVPIFVSIIGFGNEVRILSITLTALFPVLIAAMDGIRGTEPTMKMVARVYRLTWTERLFSVTLPAASPRILSGMQVGLIVAFVVMIASEMLGSSTGIGAATLLAQQTFAVTEMWSGILLLGVLGYVATTLFNIFRRRVLRWYIASQEQEKSE